MVVEKVLGQTSYIDNHVLTSPVASGGGCKRGETRWRRPLWVLCDALALGFVLLVSQPAVASPPETISHQGLLMLPNGQVGPDGVYQIKFDVCEAASGGTCGWTQTVSVNLKRGLYSVLLTQSGLKTAFSPNNTWIGMTIVSAPAGSGIAANTVLGPRQQVASVPYALSALSAASVEGGGSGQSWFAASTGSLRLATSGGANSAWTSIPGMEISVNLSVPSALVISASGHSNLYGSQDKCGNHYRVVVDGLPLNSTVPPGDLGGDMKHFMNWRYSRWSLIGRTSGGVSTGTHSVKLQAIYLGNEVENPCVICGDGAATATNDTKCAMTIQAVSP